MAKPIILSVPCAPEVLPMLRAGLAVRSVRIEERGDGQWDLIVIGARGPLSDPFQGVQPCPTCGVYSKVPNG